MLRMQESKTRIESRKVRHLITISNCVRPETESMGLQELHVAWNTEIALGFMCSSVSSEIGMHERSRQHAISSLPATQVWSGTVTVQLKSSRKALEEQKLFAPGLCVQ